MQSHFRTNTLDLENLLRNIGKRPLRRLASLHTLKPVPENILNELPGAEISTLLLARSTLSHSLNCSATNLDPSAFASASIASAA